MNDIRRWLESLGLGRYAEAFEENDVESWLIPKLNHALLKDIGVSSVGHRMSLLEAAAELARPSSPAAEVPGSPTSVSPRTDACGEAERRPLTVMFCDLVGSTALSQRLDAEDLRDVIAECQNAWRVSIERYGGYVARYMGDGVLAYFGFPQAHEDDAERAVRAGLDVVDATSSVNRARSDCELAVRVGIATGPVVVGDVLGEGASRESTVVGETPNLAARLQGQAAPDTVVIGPTTRDLLGDLFGCNDLGPLPLRGIARPVRAWRVSGERTAESRFQARAASAYTRYVGRQAEMGMLEHRWEQASRGEGQVLLPSGEPGIGKSRAVMMLAESIGAENHARLSYQCSPFHTNSPLHPVIAHLERALRTVPAEEAQAKLDKLESLLGPHVDDLASTAPLFADLLTIPREGRYPALALTPQRQKERTLAALVDWLARLSRVQPVLTVFEDIHWIDPTTQELLDLTVAAVKDKRVLLVATARPEYKPPWMGQPNTTLLQLSRLARRDVEAMVRNVAAAQSLSGETMQAIVDRADGVPLFIEELTRNIIEEGQSGTVSVPASIHASLLARLDRLEDAKELAQIGAVLGRDFSYGLLRAVAGRDPETLNGHLDRLVRSGLLRSRRCISMRAPWRTRRRRSKAPWCWSNVPGSASGKLRSIAWRARWCSPKPRTTRTRPRPAFKKGSKWPVPRAQSCWSCARQRVSRVSGTRRNDDGT